MMPRRMIGVLAAGAAMAAMLSGCGKGSHDRQDVKAALLATELLPGHFTYTETAGEQQVEVVGAVADTYRYKVEASVNRTPVLDEVVEDDAVADLFLDARGLAVFARKGSDGRLLSPPASAAAKGPTGLSVLDALNNRRWVLDATGAPQLATGTAATSVGADPVSDARNVFAYTLGALEQAFEVRKFDPESIDPVFKKGQDPFPRPAHGAPLVRYDFRPRPLPKNNQLNGGVSTNQAVPDTPNFRKLVVYVRGGRVVRIMEVIDIADQLDAFKRDYGVKLHGSRDQQAAAALAAINAVRIGQGNPPIRLRTMDFQLEDFDAPASIELPTDAVKGSLALLANRGLAPATGSSGSSSGGTSGPVGVVQPGLPSSPDTSEPTPTAPTSTAPVTTAPVTTAPVTTAPVTTAPVTTAVPAPSP
jgi:hypothetical protein